MQNRKHEVLDSTSLKAFLRNQFEIEIQTVYITNNKTTFCQQDDTSKTMIALHLYWIFIYFFYLTAMVVVEKIH